MKIRWNGHSCFTITNNSWHTLMTDPFDPKTGYASPAERVDIVTTSHHHRDHDYVEALKGYDIAVDEAIKPIDAYGFKVSSANSFHDDAEGTKRGLNSIFKIESDGQTVVHLGDLGHFPDESQLAFITGADLMLIPIGGFFTIDTDTAVEIIKSANPKAVVAMHYKAAANQYPISDETEFCKLTNAKHLGHEVEVSSLSGCCILKFE